jgi:hypothetical protein
LDLKELDVTGKDPFKHDPFDKVAENKLRGRLLNKIKDDDDDWCLTARQHYAGYVVPSLFNNYTLVNNTVDIDTYTLVAKRKG